MSVQDRRSCMDLVKQAKASGAGRAACCQVLEVSLRTLERWEKEPDKGDQRRGPDTVCAHALSAQEKQAIVEVCNSRVYRDLSPWQIVAQLAGFSGTEAAARLQRYGANTPQRRDSMRRTPRDDPAVGEMTYWTAVPAMAKSIGVGNGFRRPRPPNRACGSPAHGSPVGGFLIGIGSPVHRLQSW